MIVLGYWPPKLFRENRGSLVVLGRSVIVPSLCHIFRTRLSLQLTSTVLSARVLQCFRLFIGCYGASPTPSARGRYPWPYHNEAVALHSRKSVLDAIPMMMSTVAFLQAMTVISPLFSRLGASSVDPREPVMSLSAIPARFSTRFPKLVFTVNNRGCQLTFQMYGKESASTRNNLGRNISCLYQIGGNMILGTLRLHCLEHNHVAEECQRNCREKLGRRYGQI